MSRPESTNADKSAAPIRPEGAQHTSLGHRPRFMFPVLLLVLIAAGCDADMANQPRYEPLERSTFFGDEMASRPLVEGTVARGQLRVDEHLYQGKVAGELVETFPFEITRADLERGQERYKIFCSACHGYAGNGDGMVVQRGFPAPPPLHTDKLRQARVGHFFDVITNGYGRMLSYEAHVPAEDRWRIIAYIRALQLSQSASVSELLPRDQQALRELEP